MFIEIVPGCRIRLQPESYENTNLKSINIWILRIRKQPTILANCNGFKFSPFLNKTKCYHGKVHKKNWCKYKGWQKPNSFYWRCQVLRTLTSLMEDFYPDNVQRTCQRKKSLHKKRQDSKLMKPRRIYWNYQIDWLFTQIFYPQISEFQFRTVT